LIINCRCGTPLEVDEDMLGEEIQCPRCQTTMVAPARLLPAQPAPAQPSQRSEFTADAPQPRQLPFPAQPSQLPFSPQPGPAGVPQVVPGTITSAKAMACLNLGVNSFTVPFILAIPSFLFGLAALRECRKYRMQGQSMALTGMTLSVVSTVCLSIVFYLAYPWIKQVMDLGKGLKDGGDITKLLGKGAAGIDGSDQLKDPKTKADSILGHGVMKFGDFPDTRTTNQLREIKDMARLNRIENALRTANSWKELLATP